MGIQTVGTARIGVALLAAVTATVVSACGDKAPAKTPEQELTGLGFNHVGKSPIPGFQMIGDTGHCTFFFNKFETWTGFTEIPIDGVLTPVTVTDVSVDKAMKDPRLQDTCFKGVLVKV